MVFVVERHQALPIDETRITQSKMTNGSKETPQGKEH
jgi:hypothetical protein